MTRQRDQSNGATTRPFQLPEMLARALGKILPFLETATRLDPSVEQLSVRHIPEARDAQAQEAAHASLPLQDVVVLIAQ